MTANVISNRTRVFEISAVLITALAKFIFMDFLNWRFPFIVVAIGFWTTYVLYQRVKNPGIEKYWGFRTDNLIKAGKLVLPFAALSLVIFVCIGIFQRTINVTWHIVPILVLYPIWGIVQQYLLIALVVGNLQDLTNAKMSRTLTIICAATLFGLIHYPFGWLILGTFVLAIFYGIIYLKERNIYVLGILHGWLGALFFYTVVDRDPFLETFGPLLNMEQ